MHPRATQRGFKYYLCNYSDGPIEQRGDNTESLSCFFLINRWQYGTPPRVCMFCLKISKHAIVR